MAKVNPDMTEAEATVYTKQQIIASKRYANRRDMVNALLDDNKRYTLDEVDALIKKYTKGKVN